MNDNAKQPNLRPRTLDRQDVALEDEWGQIYDVGRIDDLNVRVSSNPAEIRFSPKLANGGVDWDEPMYLNSGGSHGWSDGVLSGFGQFQLRRAAPGSASVVNIKAICKGR